MAHADFVHLRVHTAFSLSEGALHVKELAGLCTEARMPAVAMTDTVNMFAALEFSETMAGAGVQPIIGVTMRIHNPYMTRSVGGGDSTLQSIVLLAQNEEGYRNLMALVSKAHMDSDPSELSHLELSAFDGYARGLICLTGGADGPVGKLVQDGQQDNAVRLLHDLKALFGDRLYMELQRHDLPEEHQTEPFFIEQAYALDIPLLATNQCFFADEEMYEAHDALLCIASGSYVIEEDRRRLTPEHRFKSADEMKALFSDLPEAIDNTLVVARRCAWRVEIIDPILPNFAAGADMTEAEMLRQQADKGLQSRLAVHVFTDEMDAAAREEAAKPYFERLDVELGIINRMGFPGYFLIVADFIQWAKDASIPVGPGRGSGAGSVVAWALKITDLDPLRFSLLFERFLNPERVSMPDFDIDFCQDKRDRVIRYVQEKYGYDQVAQIITFGKLQARAVLRDVGRVMQMPYPMVDRLCKLVPNNPANPVTLAQAIEDEPRLQYERDNDDLARAVITRALKLEGLYRHSSTHAAGVVIGDRKLDQLVPLYRDPRSDMPVTQFNMKWVEQAGLVKFDFLGLKTLTVLDKAVEYVAQRGIKIDLSALPFDDPASYELLQRGDTAGVFQLESSGMRAVLKGLKPDKFEDIIALVALYRPGPMDNIPTYINRKHGNETVEYPHEMLEQILEETYGVIIYQEQVMQIAQVMAGYSLGEADLLRRAMGKKKIEEMDKQRVRFVDGAREKGVDEEKASWIFDLVAKFAGYGFNKSHAAAYALVAYQTAYMKANYPVEFMAAIMTLDQGNTDKLAFFKKELRNLGIPLLLPNINKSSVDFVVEPDPDADEECKASPRAGLAIRYALAAIKGVGEKAMETLVAERDANGPYRDLFDLAARLDARSMNRRQLEQLAAAGAFDALTPDRAQAFAAAETLMRHAQRATEERDSAQNSLFGEAMGEVDRPRLPAVNPWDDGEMLAKELAAVGFYLSAHPLDSYEKVLKRLRVMPSAQVMTDNALVGQTVKVAGAFEGYQERKSRTSGKKFAYMNLSDSSGGFEVMIFERMLEMARSIAEEKQPVVATVEIKKREDDEEPRLFVSGLESLESLSATTGAGLEIFLGNGEPLSLIHGLLEKNRGGRGRVTLHVDIKGGDEEVIIDLAHGIKVTPPLRSAIAAAQGVIEVQEV